jgi:hypothetical protein
MLDRTARDAKWSERLFYLAKTAIQGGPAPFQ